MTETKKKQTMPFNIGAVSADEIDLSNAFVKSHVLRLDEKVLVQSIHKLFEDLGYIEKYGSLLKAAEHSLFVSTVVHSATDKILRDKSNPDANLKRLFDDLGITALIEKRRSERAVDKYICD